MLDKATQREGPPPENSNLGDLGTLKDTLGGDISRTLMSRLRTGADIACREHSCIRTHARARMHACAVQKSTDIYIYIYIYVHTHTYMYHTNDKDDNDDKYY